MTKRWDAIERTVHLLERVIAPTARVRRNVFLPERGTDNRRQCDIIVVTGAPPRETTSIVEVSSRSRRVGISLFEAWCAKRDKLGAQHLICVSTSGYAKSVVRSAATIGTTVRLVTLSGATPPHPGIAEMEIAPMQLCEILNREVNLLVNRLLGPGQALPTIAEATLRFGVDGPTMPVEAICDGVWTNRTVSTRLSVSRNGSALVRKFRVDLAQFGGPATIVGVTNSPAVSDFEVQETCVEHSIPMRPEILAYEQRGFERPLAWVVFGRGAFRDEEVFFTLVVQEATANTVDVRSLQVSPLKNLKMVRQGALIAIAARRQ
jgi:hypothetical protein